MYRENFTSIVVATVKNTDTTNFGHVTRVIKTSNLILHKMTSTDLDECLKTRWKVRISEKRYSNQYKISVDFFVLFKEISVTSLHVPGADPTSNIGKFLFGRRFEI